MTAAAGTFERVRELALGEVGYTESPPYSNRTKYGAWYGSDGVAWCATFDQWLFAHAGCALPIRSIYTPTLADYFRDHGAWSATPVRGALAFYSWGGKRVDHIDLVDDVNRDGSILVFGGNTSPGTSGSQNNGGCVAHKPRRKSDPIVGYGLPVYAKSKMPGGPVPLDLTHPAIYFPANAPNGSGPSSESQWLPVLLKYAAGHNAKGDPYSQFQLIPWGPRDSGPDPKTTPRDSVVVGMNWRWASTNQVFGADGGHTLRMAVDFFDVGR